MNVVITPEPMIIKKSEITPEGYHLWATHYLQCKRDFKSPDKFSPVPYFLLCRAIELEIKSKLLKTIIDLTTQDLIKRFGHNLIRAYDALDPSQQKLTKNERNSLNIISRIYNNPNKGFEYFDIVNIISRYKNLSNKNEGLPDITLLDVIASKIIDN
jgi:hypothetical protein